MKTLALKTLGFMALYVAIAVLVLIGFVVGSFGGPTKYVEVPIAAAARERLHAVPWQDASPKEMAVRYYCDPTDSPDAPDPAKLDVSIDSQSADQSVVTIVNHCTYDDSTTATCDRFTMQREGNLWLPIRHEYAWQGRGRLGWTTESTL